jgi:NAD(P)-dependent dehydrogenase (short-subunit alcohol dehydrogenase family)
MRSLFEVQSLNVNHKKIIQMAAPSPYELLTQFDASLLPFLRGRRKGRRVVVTGSQRGVGRLLCLLLALHGAHVAAGDVVIPESTRIECTEIAQLVESRGWDKGREKQTFVAIQFDAGKPGSPRSLIEAAEKQLGGQGLDHLILCHTLPEYSGMLDPTTDLLGRLKAHLEVNTLGYVECAVAALPFLRKNAEKRLSASQPQRTLLQRLLAPFTFSPFSPNNSSFPYLVSKSGITAISSLSARIPFPMTHGYAASKAAIESWFGCLALELNEAKVPVSVSIVTFAAVKTQVLIDALTKTGNVKALTQAADPTEAAMAVIKASCLGKEDTVFPANVGVVRMLYAVAPGLARWIISLFDGGSGTKAIEGKKD